MSSQPLATELKTTSNRLTGIDTLRGIVILAILIININYFSTPSTLRYNLMALGESSTLDNWVWIFEYGLIKQRFMTLLALLYGVGILLFVHKYQKLGASPTQPFIYRSLLLLLFGLVHAYLIWDGDILVAYAICGLVVYWLRNLSVTWLLVIGFILTFGAVAPDIWASFTGIFETIETPKWWYLEAETHQVMMQKYQNSWWGLTPERIAAAWERQSYSFILFTFWRCCGLMMIGMGLWKSGALLSARTLKTIAFWMLLIGLPLSLYTAWSYVESDFSYQYFQTYLGIGFYFGGILLALGYLALVLWWCQGDKFQRTQNILAKVGRMAFSLYIMQSIICGWIFFGYGFDLFGQVSRSELWIYTVGIWIFQIIFTLVWFKYFKRGPLEAVWRQGYEWAANR